MRNKKTKIKDNMALMGDIGSGLSNTQSIWVSGFEEEDLQSFYQQFMALEQDPASDAIVIYVSSYGGSLNNALAMRDLIKSSSKVICTAGIGKVMSAGVIVLACGTKGYRFISPDTSLMIHQASMGAEGKSSEVLSSAEFLKHINALMFKNLSIDTGTPLNKFREMIRDNENADLYISVDTCVKLGIVDRIEIPKVISGMSRTMVIAGNKPKTPNKKDKK